MKVALLSGIILITGILKVLATPYDTTLKKIPFIFTYSKNIFSENWQADPINAAGVAISETEIPRTKQIMATTLDKYPESVLQQDLKQVCYLKSMSFYGVEFGGTNDKNALYLTNDGVEHGYTNKYLEQNFHHEFSSILLRNHIQFLDTASWVRASSLSMVYNDSLEGVGAIVKHEDSQAIDTNICKKGALTQYALSGMENDVNTFAQNMFKPEALFWYAVDHYPLIRIKLMLLVAFYNKLSPLFTEAYFRQFATQ